MMALTSLNRANAEEVRGETRIVPVTGCRASSSEEKSYASKLATEVRSIEAMTEKLGKMTINELVSHFAEICVAEDEALLHEQYAKFNRLFTQMSAVGYELIRRGRDARLELQKLHRHPNLQVRLKAAKWSLGVNPVEARKVIQSIYDSKFPPQSGDAGMCLSNLDDGTFKPD